MKKRGITKSPLAVTIDKEILKRFIIYCKENSINKSQLVERLLRKFMEDKK